MAKLKIKKIEIAAVLSDCDKMMRLIQRYGCVELSSVQNSDLVKSNNLDKINELEAKQRVVSEATVILSKRFKGKDGLLSSLKEKTALTDDEYNNRVKGTEEVFKACEKAVLLNKEIADNKASLIRCNSLVEAYKPWQELDIKLNYSGTKNVAAILGSVPKSMDREAILSYFAQKLPEIDCVDVEIASCESDLTCFCVFCSRNNAEAVELSLRQLGYSRLSEPPELTAKEKIAEIEATIKETQNRLESIDNELNEIAQSYDEISFLADYLSIEYDRAAAMDKLMYSQSIAFLEGYIPEAKCEKVQNEIEKKFCACVCISEPEEDEDVPVMLKNNGFAAPVENITNMYSVPGKKDIDPTPIMAFFYYVFFGMMLSDAGYGLIIALATGFVLLKFKMEEKMRNTVKMYFFCGLSTVFWGAMYGSWFGDLPNVVGDKFFGTDIFESTAIWLDPLEQLMELLVYCFIFGIIHLFTGVIVKAVNLAKHGKKLDAFCESVPVAVLIFGFCPIFFGLFTEIPQWLSTIGTPALIAGVLLVIATQGRESKSIVGKIGGGLYALYNLVSGYLGDVLSYARLLALGLSTGVIAQVVNMLCTLPSNNVLKAIMLVVVGAFGHIVNLAINIIGAYVHTNRLQYVEFFSKFYEGGGRAMQPLIVNTKKFKFKDIQDAISKN